MLILGLWVKPAMTSFIFNSLYKPTNKPQAVTKIRTVDKIIRFIFLLLLLFYEAKLQFKISHNIKKNTQMLFLGTELRDGATEDFRESVRMIFYGF